MEELLEKMDCSDYSDLLQHVIAMLDDDLSDLAYMIDSENYSKNEIYNKISDIRRMLM